MTEFFDGCSVVSVRIIEDREMQRPKGFGYVEFTDLDGLKKALDLDGESFQGRMIKIKIADPRMSTTLVFRFISHLANVRGQLVVVICAATPPVT